MCVRPFVRLFVRNLILSFFPKWSYGVLKPYITLSNQTNQTNKTNKTNKTNETNKTNKTIKTKLEQSKSIERAE